jgi:hypothetical protein
MTVEEIKENNKLIAAINSDIKKIGYSDAVLYKILELPGCPVTLPKARSMTQARMDLEHLKPAIIEWYNTQTP